MESLRSLKKVQSVEKKLSFSKFIIVGHDIFAVKAFFKLNQKYPGQVKIVSEKEITLDSLKNYGPTLIRGESSQAWLETNYPHLLGPEQYGESQFFKDQKFHRFSGRSKSEALLFNEEFFKEKRIPFKENEFLKNDLPENAFEVLKLNQLTSPLLHFIHDVPDHLINQSNYELYFASGDWWQCEKLVWALSPSEFPRLCQDKEKLANEFLEFCESTHTPLSLQVSFLFEQAIQEQQETIFIPLSHTHDWGHFIGEFDLLDDGSQLARFFTNIDPEQSTEEEVSKAIRLLKRSLEKIFEKFSTASFKEYIVLSEKSPCLNIDDNKFKFLCEHNPHLIFIGQNAPFETISGDEDSFEYSSFGVHGYWRGLLSLEKNLNNA